MNSVAPQNLGLDAEAPRIHYTWLIRLRWGAIALQLALIGAAYLPMEGQLPLQSLLAVVALEALFNLAAMAWVGRASVVRERTVALAMAADVLLFTALLYLTGGPLNPFSFLYLVPIALAAVVLRTAWTWALSALSVLSFGSLFFLGRAPPAAMAAHHHHAAADPGMDLHLRGMWVAMGLSAAFIVYFLSRINRSLRLREAQLAAIAARSERLASLATLAAGAAHELSSPLTTIAVVAKDLERPSGSASAAEDVQLIRREVDRCREILRQMAADAGETAGEPFAAVTFAELLTDVMDGVSDKRGVTLAVQDGTAAKVVSVPRRAIAQALRAVVKNAQQATEGAGPVELRAAVQNGDLRIEVSDRGVGMSPSVLARAGEPFFTTKEPGRGMGLGLFLTRTLFQRLGGGMAIDSSPARGTTVVLTLPVPAGTP